MKKYSDLILTSFIFLFSFIIYLITVAPDLTFTDSGELAGACATLGIAHPTGYPLFTILGHMWTYLPISVNEIYSLNIFAGFLTALSAAFFFRIIYFLLEYANNAGKVFITKPISSKRSKSNKSELQQKHEPEEQSNKILLISLSVALTYAFSRTIWGQAVAIEVYSLHLLLINITLYFFLKGIFKGGRNYLILASFFLGLSFTNHMTTILIVPMMAFLFFTERSEQSGDVGDKFRYLLVLTIPFLIGLSLYLYLPLRAATMPDFNWGWVSRSFEKFWYHFTGKQYQVWMFSGADIMKENLARFFEAVPNQFAWIGIAPFLAGVWILFRKAKKLFLGFVILIILCLLYAINYSIHDIESYFIAAFIGMFIFMAYGLMRLAHKYESIAYLSFIIPLMSIGLNYSYNNRSDDYSVPEYTRIVFQKLEPNAIILSSQWDYWVSASWYKQKVEGFREDVVIIDKELLRRTWYLEQLRRWYPERMKTSEKEIEDYLIDLELFESGEYYNPASIQRKFIALLKSFIDKNIDKYPVYLTLDVLESEPEISEDYLKVTDGLSFRLVKDFEPDNITLRDVDIDKFVSSINSNHGYLIDGIRTSAAISFVNAGRYLLMKKKRDEALTAFQKAYKIDPTNKFVIEAVRNIDNFQFVE